MRLTILSTLSLLSLGLMASEAVNTVRIDVATGLVCLILPPAGKIIGDTQQDGHVQCTDGTPELLPSSFFVSKNFETTTDYVQAWGLMNDTSVGMLKSDGGGQYDIHADSGDNVATGYPVFVELLEPDTGRWCIRFCHALGKVCNMGDSSAGCEGALGITNWPTSGTTAAGSGNTTTTSTAKTSTTKTASSTVTSSSTVTTSAGASTSSTTGSTSTVTSSTGSTKASLGSYQASLGAIVPFTVMASAVYSLFL
ncbi:hypothetical protein EDD21DRAFT_382001 [Dissophora ornata]|nr:hypothetical protein EDD21DRAFT_382001 [Dissophora ornata]